jgi:hypothetical protein
MWEAVAPWRRLFAVLVVVLVGKSATALPDQVSLRSPLKTAFDGRWGLSMAV